MRTLATTHTEPPYTHKRLWHGLKFYNLYINLPTEKIRHCLRGLYNIPTNNTVVSTHAENSWDVDIFWSLAFLLQ